ncbi:MAG: PAS domain-containing protein [Deltaproteobacteria bacterium]|nr:PAS domain-containing protein [Deltaproteobacteria bacterium]
MNNRSVDHRCCSPEFCAAILQQAPYGVLVCSPDGVIDFANQLAAFLLQRQELCRHKLTELLSELPEIKHTWEKLLEDENFSTAIPMTIRPAAGNPRESTHISLKFNRLVHGSELAILVFLEDLSANETLDFADQHYTDSLENLVDEKSRELEMVQEQLIMSEKKTAMIETAGAIAHELRQPMTAIIGITDLLNDDPALKQDAQLRKRLGIINKQCLRMAEIIKKMGRLVEYRTRPYIKGSVILDIEESSQTDKDEK